MNANTRNSRTMSITIAKHLSPASDAYSAALYWHLVNVVHASELSARCFPKVQSRITKLLYNIILTIMLNSEEMPHLE